MAHRLRSAMLGSAALALTACQSAPEASQPAAPEPSLGPVAAPPRLGNRGSIGDVTPLARTFQRRTLHFRAYGPDVWKASYEGKLAVLSVSSKGAATVAYAWGKLGDNNPGVADGAGRIVGTR